MKTITLTDSAYSRLKDWKASSQESFSSVVMRLVPEKGTLGQMLQDVVNLPVLDEKQARIMEETVAYGRKPDSHRDSWTS